MTIPPNLNDPAQFAAYRRELKGVASPLRRAGLAFAVLGVLLAIGRSLWWPAMPVAIPGAALALAVFNLIGGIAIRMLYHARRMKGE